MEIGLRTGIYVVIVLLVLIVLLLVERPEQRPRALVKMLLLGVLGLAIYKIGPIVVAALGPAIVAAKPAFRVIGREAPELPAYLFVGLLVSLDVFWAYTLIRGWKRTDTFRQKWAAVAVVLSAVCAVLTVAGLFIQDWGLFGLPALALFYVGALLMPISPKQPA